MLENRFYKVSHSGGSYVTGCFFNPITLEEKSCTLRDYDYSDCSRDNDELYYMPIDEAVRHMWLNHHGIITKGDTVEVFKGRKIPHGTIAVVKDITEWRDCYGRVQTVYAVFTNGKRTSIDNCRLVS